MSLKGLKFLILLGIFAAGCMTANEGSSCDDTPKIVHDTLRIVRVDTLRIRDTVFFRDTILATKHLDTPTVSGVWFADYTGNFPGDGKTASIAMTLAFTDGDIVSAANFSATRRTNGTPMGINGRVKTLSGGSATIYWSGGGASGDCTWLITLDGKDMLVQEIGGGFFWKDAAVRFHR